MGNKANGMMAGRRLKLKRKAARWHNKWFVKKALNLKTKADPLSGSSQAKGIVLEKVQLEAKQPHTPIPKK